MRCVKKYPRTVSFEIRQKDLLKKCQETTGFSYLKDYSQLSVCNARLYPWVVWDGIFKAPRTETQQALDKSWLILYLFLDPCWLSWNITHYPWQWRAFSNPTNRSQPIGPRAELWGAEWEKHSPADPDGTEEGKAVVAAGLGLGRVTVDPIQDHTPSKPLTLGL